MSGQWKPQSPEAKARKNQYMRERHLAVNSTCKRGHEFTPENTVLHQGPKRTTRRCKKCMLEHSHWGDSTVCHKGHPRTPENTRVNKDRSKTCLVCLRLRTESPEARERRRERDRLRSKTNPYLDKRCTKGHEFTAENTTMVKWGDRMIRRCNTCTEAQEAKKQAVAERRARHARYMKRKREQARAAREAARRREQEWFDWVIPWQVANDVPVSRPPTDAEFAVIMQESRRLANPEIARRVGCGLDRVRVWRRQNPETAFIEHDPRELAYPGLR